MSWPELEVLERLLSQRVELDRLSRLNGVRRRYLKKHGLVAPAVHAGVPTAPFAIINARLPQSRVRLPLPVIEWILERGGAPFARAILMLCYPDWRAFRNDGWCQRVRAILERAHELIGTKNE